MDERSRRPVAPQHKAASFELSVCLLDRLYQQLAELRQMSVFDIVILANTPREGFDEYFPDI